MKKLAKLLVTVLFCLGVAFAAVTPVFAAVAQVKNVKTSVTATTVTLSWNKVSGASGYVVQKYNGKKWKAIATTQKTKHTVKKLTAGTTYKFRVRAYKGSGKKIQYGKVSAAVSAKPVCIAPKTVSAVSASATSVKLSWSKLSNANGYLIQKKNSGKWVNVANTKNTSAVVSGLATNVEVKFRVRGYKTVGNKNVLGKAKAVTAKPTLAAPANVKATVASSTTANVSWSAVSGATGYFVQRYNAAGKKWVTVGSTSKTTLTATGLIPTTSNQIRVFGFVKSGSKNLYGTVSKTVSVKPTIANVTELVCDESNSTTASLSWNAVSGATGYTVYVKNGTAYKQVAVSKTNSCTVTGLASNTEYTFAVRAYITASDSKNYFSAYSNTFTWKTAPAAVTNLSATKSTDNTLSLTWDASADEKAIERYEIFVLILKRNPDGTQENEWVSLGSVPTGTKTFTVSKIRYRDSSNNYVEVAIEEKTPYEFKVQGYSLYAPDPNYPTDRIKLYSTAASFTATTALSRVLNLKTENPTSSSLTVSWTKNSKATGYELEISKDKNTWTVVDLSKCILVTSDNVSLVIYTVPELEVSTTYYFRVKAIAGDISSTLSDIAEGKTTPAAITELTYDNIKPTSLSVKWKAVEGAVKYEVFWIDGTKANADWEKLTDTEKTEFSKNQLSPYTEYQFKVRAYTEGQSVPSDFSNPVVVKTALQSVNADVQVTKCTSSMVYIGWTISAKAASYKLETSPDGKDNWQEVKTEKPLVNPTDGSEMCVYKYEGLAPSTSLFFRVTAINGTDSSEVSAVAEAKTAPAPVEGVSATALSDTSFSVSWKKNTGIDKYTVQYKKSSASDWSSVDVSNTTAKIESLAQCTDYTVRVIAYEAFRSQRLSSTPSAESKVKTLLSAPTSFKATDQTTDSISFSWTKNSNAGVNGYRIEMSDNGKTGWTSVLSVDAKETSATVKNLSASKTAYFRIAAVDKSNTAGVASANAIGITLPAKPTVTISDIKDTSVKLDWSGATLAASYKVEKSTDGKTWSDVIGSPFNGTSGTVTGLTQNTAYCFRVTGQVKINNVLKAGESTVTKAVKTMPSTVANFNAEATGTDSVKLTWTKVDGISYLIQVDNNSEISVTGDSYTVTGLKPGTTYSFKIKAVSGENQSEVFLKEATTKVAAVTNLKAECDDNNKITLSWSSANGTATKYDILEDGKAIESAIKNTTYTKTIDKQNQTVSFTVKAYTDDKNFAESTVTITTKLLPVSNVKVTERTENSATLSFSANLPNDVRVLDNGGNPLAPGSYTVDTSKNTIKITGLDSNATTLNIVVVKGDAESAKVQITIGAYVPRVTQEAA